MKCWSLREFSLAKSLLLWWAVVLKLLLLHLLLLRLPLLFGKMLGRALHICMAVNRRDACHTGTQAR